MATGPLGARRLTSQCSGPSHTAFQIFGTVWQGRSAAFVGRLAYRPLTGIAIGRRDVKLTGLDHIVLCVADVERTLAFYEKVLGMQPREERPGKWSLHFGSQKISLQDARSAPDLARETVPGSGNFCVLTDEPVERVAETLRRLGIQIVAGPDERDGATGKILSVYFRDPDRNLVEVSNRLRPREAP